MSRDVKKSLAKDLEKPGGVVGIVRTARRPPSGEGRFHRDAAAFVWVLFHEQVGSRASFFTLRLSKSLPMVGWQYPESPFCV